MRAPPGKYQLAEARGRRAEFIAAWYLRLKGYRVLARRVRTPSGEIDLIVARGEALVFVEVKQRGSRDSALEMLGGATLKRVTRAADYLRVKYSRFPNQRIDVVVISKSHWPHHLQNVGLDVEQRGWKP
jgi:putative endonuclease